MRHIKRNDLLLGAGVIGIGLFGVVQPSLADSDKKENKAARKEVKQARKEVKKQKKDVAKADTRQERREERADVRAARENFQRERQEYRQERRDNNRRYDYKPRNGYNRRDYNRRDVSVMEGTVSRDTIDRNTFRMLLNSGGQITVRVQGGVPNRLDRGDRVRIYGKASNGVFYADRVSFLNDR